MAFRKPFVYSFQSTPSAWRETTGISFNTYQNYISIHSLRMEGDRLRRAIHKRPYGFQSTPSAWRETTVGRVRNCLQCYFNPLPPHGGRLDGKTSLVTHRLFQSTPSAWRETIVAQAFKFSNTFQSTPSAWRETLRSVCCKVHQTYFNPLPPHGGRQTTSGYTGC